MVEHFGSPGKQIFLQRMRRLAAKPFVVGFGIKGGAQVRALGPHADGVVVGSALIDAIEVDSDDPAIAAARLLAPLRAAADEIGKANKPGRGLEK